MHKKPRHKKNSPKPNPKVTPEETSNQEASEGMRLNKYIAHCGICSRRKAAEFIKDGLVKVNDKVVAEIGYRVLETDQVKFQNKIVTPEVNRVYLLMNKPKDTVTTLKDERGRKTVMDLVANTVKERIYPVGRLDRATTGLLLLTNDGELAKKLSHPSHNIKKIYHVFLDQDVAPEDIKKIANGLQLEDGPIKVDGVSYVQGKGKQEVGVEIHSGRNRIVRRIFEHLKYRVKKLDRVYYAGLTKKDLPRGRFRFLTEKEVIMLKHFV